MSEQETATTEPIHVESAEQFEEYVSDGGLYLVDFHADWCGPCKMLEPTIDELAAETSATVLKVDIDELQTFAQQQGIRSVPTLQFYVDGEKAEQLIGVQDKDDLKAIIDSLQ